MILFRRLALIVSIACAAMPLSACALSPPLEAATPTAPAVIADKTTLDERAALSVELAYQAGATLLIAAVDAGWLDERAQIRAFNAERDAWSAVEAVRTAYDAGNASNYAAALDLARSSVANLMGYIRKGDTS